MSNLLDYWKDPTDEANKAETYLTWGNRSQYILSIFNQFVKKDWSILELGCNVGRNLAYLYNDGYQNLSGIDISKRALDIGRGIYKDVFSCADIRVGEIGKVVKSSHSDQYDCVFTMAVLTHLPQEYDETIKDIARVAKKCVITVEYEGTKNWKHFPRNYGDIFKELGWREVYVNSVLANYDLPNLTCRVFLY